MRQKKLGALLHLKIQDKRYKRGFTEKFGRIEFTNIQRVRSQLYTDQWAGKKPLKIDALALGENSKVSTLRGNFRTENPMIYRLLKHLKNLGFTPTFYITQKVDGFCDRTLEKAIISFGNAFKDSPKPKLGSTKLYERFPDTFQNTKNDSIFLKYDRLGDELIVDEQTNIAALALKHKEVIDSKSENTKLASNVNKYKHKDHDNLNLTLNKLIEIVNFYQEELYLVLSWEMTRADFNAWKRLGLRNKSERLIIDNDDNLIDEFADYVDSNGHGDEPTINPAIEYFMQQAYLPIMKALKTKNGSWRQERYVRDIEHILLKYGQQETLDWLPLPPKKTEDNEAENA